jgi:beta-glucosidase
MSATRRNDPQFAYGFGLSYASPAQTATLPEVAETTRYGERNVYYAKGTAWNGYKLSIGDSNTPHVDHVGTRTTLNGSAGLMLESQGDGALLATWNGASKTWLEMGGKTQRRQPRGQRRDDAHPHCARQYGSRCRGAAGRRFRFGAGDRWTEGAPHRQLCDLAVPLSCFSAQDLMKTPIIVHLETSGNLDLLVSDIRLTEAKKGATCPTE